MEAESFPSLPLATPPFFVHQPIDLNLSVLAPLVNAPFGQGKKLMDALHKVFPHMRKFILSVLDVSLITTLVQNNFPVVVELQKFESKNLPQYETALKMNVPITLESPPENINDRAQLRHLIVIISRSLDN